MTPIPDSRPKAHATISLYYIHKLVKNMPPQETVPTNVPVSSAVAMVPTVPLQMGKFKASKTIVRESWNVLRQDKEILWFPVLSAIASIFALTVFSGILFVTAVSGGVDFFSTAQESLTTTVSYAVLFVYYLVMFFIVSFFQAGVYTIVHGRFNGQDLSFSDGMKGATDNVGKIFLWSLISATVGVILQIIADRSKLLGKIVAWLLSAAWGILTFFSLPSLIIGRTSVRQSFSDSASVIRKTWGETIIVNIGVGLFFSLLIVIEIIFAVGVVVLVPSFGVLLGVAVLSIIYWIVLAVVSSSLGAIFKLALYEYATTGKIPQGFSPEIIQNAVSKK